jgi:APA family basic amino acid/polyamine antiporter
MPVVPAIGVVFSLWLISFLGWHTWLRFGIWLLIGLIIYFAYSYRNSNMNRPAPAVPGGGAAPGGPSDPGAPGAAGPPAGGDGPPPGGAASGPPPGSGG